MHAHLPGVKEVPSEMPSNVKIINELISVHKTTKEYSYEYILYCETCKNLEKKFEIFKKKIIYLAEFSVVI